jgi:FtsH-binding integral membrane protein
MKNFQWVIVGIGVLTGGVFLLMLLANADSAVVFTNAIKTAIFLGIAIGTGFFTIRALSFNYKINIHKAILAPWLAVIIVAVVINFFTSWGVSILVTFVFASVGGVWAYKINQRKNII